MNTALRTSAVKENFATFAGQTLVGTPEDLARLMRDETAKWTQVVRAAGIKGEYPAPWRGGEARGERRERQDRPANIVLRAVTIWVTFVEKDADAVDYEDYH